MADLHLKQQQYNGVNDNIRASTRGGAAVVPGSTVKSVQHLARCQPDALC